MRFVFVHCSPTRSLLPAFRHFFIVDNKFRPLYRMLTLEVLKKCYLCPTGNELARSAAERRSVALRHKSPTVTLLMGAFAKSHRDARPPCG